MVPKGLKKGDTFTDGGLYKVLDVLPSGNYISERLAKTAKAAAEAPAKTDTPLPKQPAAAPRAPRKRRK